MPGCSCAAGVLRRAASGSPSSDTPAIARNAASGWCTSDLHEQRDHEPAEVAGHPHDRAGGAGGGAGEPLGGGQDHRQRRQQHEAHRGERERRTPSHGATASATQPRHADEHGRCA